MLRRVTLAASLALMAAAPAHARSHRHHHRHHHHAHATGGCGSLARIVARSGASACVAHGAAPRFQGLIGDLEARGYPIAFLGGWRRHGSVPGSLHPFGYALDINQTGRNRVTHRFPAGLTAIAHRHGLTSGGEWRNSDVGHFELALYAHMRRHT